MTLCACAALLSLAEVLMPDGAVKKTAYLVMSLIAASCMASPLMQFEPPELDSVFEPAETTVGSDWLLRPTQRQFEENVASLVDRRLRSLGINARRIEASAQLSPDGSAALGKVKITVNARDADRMDEIESVVLGEFGAPADVVTEGG